MGMTGAALLSSLSGVPLPNASAQNRVEVEHWNWQNFSEVWPWTPGGTQIIWGVQKTPPGPSVSQDVAQQTCHFSILMWE